MSVLNSVLVAVFLMAVVFCVLCGLYLFIEAFSLSFSTISFAFRKKKPQTKA